MNNDFDLFAGTVNPDPYPHHGSSEQQRAWWDKDRALKSGRKSATASQKTEGIRGDGFDLPVMPEPIGPYPRDGTYDDRTVWVQRASVACATAGVTAAYGRAIELEWLRLMEECKEQRIMELTQENSDLTIRLQKAELAYIDGAAEKIFEAVRLFILEEFTREKAVLERRVLAIATKSQDYDSPNLDVLNAKVVVLMQRAAELEQLNPLWCSIHSGQRV